MAVYDQMRSPFFTTAATSAALDTNCLGSKSHISATERPLPEPSSRNSGRGMAVKSVIRPACRPFCAHCFRIGNLVGEMKIELQVRLMLGLERQEIRHGRRGRLFTVAVARVLKILDARDAQPVVLHELPFVSRIHVYGHDLMPE